MSNDVSGVFLVKDTKSLSYGWQAMPMIGSVPVGLVSTILAQGYCPFADVTVDMASLEDPFSRSPIENKIEEVKARPDAIVVEDPMGYLESIDLFRFVMLLDSQSMSSDFYDAKTGNHKDALKHFSTSAEELLDRIEKSEIFVKPMVTIQDINVTDQIKTFELKPGVELVGIKPKRSFVVKTVESGSTMVVTHKGFVVGNPVKVLNSPNKLLDWLQDVNVSPSDLIVRLYPTNNVKFHTEVTFPGEVSHVDVSSHSLIIEDYEANDTSKYIIKEQPHLRNYGPLNEKVAATMLYKSCALPNLSIADNRPRLYNDVISKNNTSTKSIDSLTNLEIVKISKDISDSSLNFLRIKSDRIFLDEKLYETIPSPPEEDEEDILI